jgi:hypothetical protein
MTKRGGSAADVQLLSRSRNMGAGAMPGEQLLQCGLSSRKGLVLEARSEHQVDQGWKRSQVHAFGTSSGRCTTIHGPKRPRACDIPASTVGEAHVAHVAGLA